jgi:type I restriction-modification system DNA methylase subunit
MTSPQSEARIHFEFYRYLQNAIEEGAEYYGVRFTKAIPEKPVDGGSADIVVEDPRGPLLVIEAKRKTEVGYDRNLDPYSPKIIGQALDYAVKLGAKYFATYNGKQLVLFRTFEEGVHFLERKARAYEVKDPKQFAPEFLKQVAAIKSGKIGWEPRPRAFVKRLKTFHGRLAQELGLALKDKLSDRKFKRDFENWITRQGWDIEENEKQSRFMSQASYLLLNKLLFYKVLEDTGHDVPELPLESLVGPEERRKAFDRVIKAVDFEPIYQHDPIFDEVPLTERASLEVGEFLEELGSYDLGKFKHDTIGHIYEGIIPPEERHGLGQYYTPPEIVELITKLTIRSPEDKVLDPGCGSGTFLITAYNILKELREKEGLPAGHRDILGQLYGIDINRFPAHLTAINLALRDLGAKTEQVNVEVQDFFNVRPYQDRITVERVDAKLVAKGTGEWEFKIPPQVDVVATNPPYIRQEIIPDKKLCRKHLKRLGYEGMSERSDIYAYFFTHATEFLRENGRMGFITSDKWLTVGYGKDLQKFFLDNFKIKAIISFSRRVFEAPLVPTCVTVLERCEDEKGRDSNIARFIRVKGGLDLDDLVQMIEADYEPSLLQEKENYRLITKKQVDLREAEKWNRYLHAPRIYWDLLSHKKICRLGDVVEVRRGITSGANDFFYLKKEEAEGWGIDKKFLRPVAKSIRQAKSVRFTEKDTDTYVIDVHDYMEEKLRGVTNERLKGIKLVKGTLPANANLKELSPEEEYILHCLYKNGYKGLYQYIVHAMWEKDWGDKNPPHKRPTCLQYRRQNKCWFNLGSLRKPDLIFAVGCWERVFTPLNSDGMILDKRLYEIYPKRNTKVLGAVLNSSLYRLFRELHGRTTGAGMSEFTVYEAEDLPVLNPNLMTKNEKKIIRIEFEKLLKSNKLENLELDKAVLAPLGLENRAEEISAYAEALSKARREGKEAGVMIEGIEEKEAGVRELKGAEVVSEKIGQKKLTEF